MNPTKSLRLAISNSVVNSHSHIPNRETYSTRDAFYPEILHHLEIQPSLKSGDQFIVETIASLTTNEEKANILTAELVLVSGFRLEMPLAELVKLPVYNMNNVEYHDEEKLIILENEILQVFRQENQLALRFTSCYSFKSLPAPIATLEEFKRRLP